MNYLRIWITVIIATLGTFYSVANSHSISQQSFSCEINLNDIPKSLKAGAQSFIIEIKQEQQSYTVSNTNIPDLSLEHVFKQFIKYQEENTNKHLTLIITGDINKDSINHLLNIQFSNKYSVYSPSEKKVIGESSDNNNISLLVVYEDEITRTSADKIKKNLKYQDRFSKEPLNRLVLFSSQSSKSNEYLRNCINSWNTTGKLPNFIYSSHLPFQELNHIADSLNQVKRFSGEVVYNNSGLNEIYWNHARGVISPAQFSFPMLKSSAVYKPHKHGYKISPGEVIHHDFMSDNPRLFNAYDMREEDDLVYSFAFDGDQKNKMESNWNGSILKGAKFIKDRDRGTVLHFSKSNSFIDYGKKNSLNFNAPISISVWIKPYSIHDYNGIVGFGSSFSFKLHQASPDFTTATIRDHIVKDKIQVNKWTHLAVVFSPDYTVRFYINGTKVDEIVTSEINPNDHALVIGNNVWSEQFYGSIDDLKIWNRGLSQREVQQLYQQNIDGSHPTMLYTAASVILLVLILLYLQIRRKKKSKQPAQQVTSTDEPVSTSKLPEITTGIRLFGTFQWIVDGHEKSIPGFSPLLKQILTYLILSSLKSEQGVHVSQFTETFWPGFPPDKAKDNRGTNIKRLRKILQSFEGINIVYQDKKWKIDCADDLFVDIKAFQLYKARIKEQLDNQQLNMQDVKYLLFLIQPGNILQNTHAEWLDPFKNQLTEEVIELLTSIYQEIKNASNKEVATQLAKTMLLFDQLNEFALKVLLNELVSVGKHGMAKDEYNHFCKHYSALYGEDFSLSYQHLID